MSNSVQSKQIQYISINTDFGYDSLGGVGKIGKHEVEALNAPSVRQSTRIPGPPQTAGRWFSRLLDKLTPASWRAQGKYKRGLEDFSAQTGKILGHLFNAAQTGTDQTEKLAARSAALKELASLRHTAEPLTKRGTDYNELLAARVRVNLDILNRENPLLFRQMQEIKENGTLDGLINSLDPETQSDMTADLKLIRDTIPAMPQTAAETIRHTEEQSETGGTAPSYQSHFSLADLKNFFLRHFSPKEQALKELRENQEKLGGYTEEAKRLLTECIEEIQSLYNSTEPADMRLLSDIQHNTEDKMKKAIQCAVDDVCRQAFKYLDTQTPVGSEGQDFRRIDAALVQAELNKIENNTPMPAASQSHSSPSGGPFLQAIQNAKRQILEISSLYGEMTENLEAVKNRNIKYGCAAFLHELAEQAPASENVSTDYLPRLCDALIEDLQTENTGSASADRLLTLQTHLKYRELPEDLKNKAEEMLPQLRHALAPDPVPPFSLTETVQAAQSLNDLEKLKALHQVVGHAGALLQQAKLPQADILLGQALQISRQIFQIQTANRENAGDSLQRQIRELQSTLSRFMTNTALAQMQTENPTVRSSLPEAKNLNPEPAKNGLNLLQKSLRLLAGQLEPERGKAVALAALNNGEVLKEKGILAAKACKALLQNRFNKDPEAAEQLAVCLESGRTDADAPLKALLADKKWDKGKHLEAKKAILDFLEALTPVKASRQQNELMLFLTNRLSNAFVTHDAYRGFDGSFHLLVNTDQKNMLGDSKKLQKTKWITLPPPNTLQTGKPNTGMARLDSLLAAGDNLTEFYPRLYDFLEKYFSGTPYNLDLNP